MSNFETVIDFGSQNLRLGAFNLVSKNIYSSEQKILDNQENSLNILVKDAEKHLSTHIDNVVVLYDSPKFYVLDICIRKVFDHAVPIKQVYANLIDEAQFFVSQNNFKDQIIHTVINDIIVENDKKLDKITEDLKIKSLILEIKFICLSKIIVNDVSNKFKNNNLKIINLYCSSYVKTAYFKKKFDKKDCVIFLDIGFERTSGFIFKNCKLDFFKSIPLGGNNITKDISKVLKLSMDYSEDLKIQFNNEEIDYSFDKTNNNKINPYSEILEKKISINLLKQIIEARIDEIMELAVFKSNSIKNLNTIEKPKLFIAGGGSQLFSNSYRVGISDLISKLTVINENKINIFEIGASYHKSDESFLSKAKKKVRKMGFFEAFFNLFSK